MNKKKHSRRSFIKTSSSAIAGLAAFPYILPSNILGRNKIISPNDKIRIGCIGIGWQGTGNMEAFLRETCLADRISSFETVDTETEGAIRVLEGKADAFVYDLPFNAVFNNMNPSEKVIFLDQPFTKEPIAWALRKKDPGFMKFLNDFLAEIKGDGRFDKMYDKWFNNSDWYRFVR